MSPCLAVLFACVLKPGHAFRAYFIGGFKQESNWVFGEVSKFAVSRGADRKPVFKYQLPQVGDVCRVCWILSAGGAIVRFFDFFA